MDDDCDQTLNILKYVIKYAPPIILNQTAQSSSSTSESLRGIKNSHYSNSMTTNCNCNNSSNINNSNVENNSRHVRHTYNKVEPQSSVFGLPPTPPSSMSILSNECECEGNQSPEHHLISPMPPTNIQISTIAGITTPRSSSSSSSSTSSSSLLPSSVTASTSTSASITTSVSTRSSSLHSTSLSHHTSTSTVRLRLRSSYNGTSTRQPIHTPLISSQPKGSTGTLVLTEEEKRRLIDDGYPIPTRLPLTEAEEYSLNKIRGKIRNNISVRASRRKKKEYMDQLQRKVEILVSENSDYRKRVETLEDSNANLLNELARLQTLLKKNNKYMNK